MCPSNSDCLITVWCLITVHAPGESCRFGWQTLASCTGMSCQEHWRDSPVCAASSRMMLTSSAPWIRCWHRDDDNNIGCNSYENNKLLWISMWCRWLFLITTTNVSFYILFGVIKSCNHVIISRPQLNLFHLISDPRLKKRSRVAWTSCGLCMMCLGSHSNSTCPQDQRSSWVTRQSGSKQKG